MPSFTTIIEDTSPILQYIFRSAWESGSASTSNLSADHYTQSTYTLTQDTGASMYISFTGTGITLVGAMLDTHGQFTVDFDGTTTTHNGFSNTPAFNQTLFSRISLEKGNHTLLLSNLESPSLLDVDYVIVETQIGNDDEDLIVNTFQDTHPSFSYTPISSWKTPDLVSQYFSGSSGHSTKDPSASMSLFFQGDGITIYGLIGPDQADSYTVIVDGGPVQSFPAVNQFYRPRQILFHVTGLGGGFHTLTMQLASGSSGELAIDFANAYTVPSIDGSFLVSTFSQEHIPITLNAPLPTDIIVALSITSAFTLAALVTLIYFIWKRIVGKRRKILNSYSSRQGNELDGSDTYGPPIISIPRPTSSRNLIPRLRSNSEIGRASDTSLELDYLEENRSTLHQGQRQ